MIILAKQRFIRPTHKFNHKKEFSPDVYRNSKEELNNGNGGSSHFINWAQTSLGQNDKYSLSIKSNISNSKFKNINKLYVSNFHWQSVQKRGKSYGPILNRDFSDSKNECKNHTKSTVRKVDNLFSKISEFESEVPKLSEKRNTLETTQEETINSGFLKQELANYSDNQYSQKWGSNLPDLQRNMLLTENGELS